MELYIYDWGLVKHLFLSFLYTSIVLDKHL